MHTVYAVQGFDIMGRDALRIQLSQHQDCTAQRCAYITCCAGLQNHGQMPDKVEATKAMHEPLQVVGHAEQVCTELFYGAPYVCTVSVSGAEIFTKSKRPRRRMHRFKL